MKTRFFCLLALFCALNTPVWAQKATKTAQSKIDPRAETALRKMVAAYEKLGEFSITSLDTKTNYTFGEGEAPARRFRASGRFGKNGRAALKVETLNVKGQPTGIALAQLSDGTTFYQVGNRGSATIETLAELQGEEKNEATRRFFRASPALQAIAIGLRLKTLSFSEVDSKIGFVTFRSLPNGDSQVEASENGPDGAGSSFRLTLAPSGFLRKMETRLVLGLTSIGIESQLSTPIPLRGDDNFSWKTFAPPPDPNFSIPDAARALFERAAKLYGALNSLSVRAVSTSTINGKSKTERGGFDWERRGLLRYENQALRKSVVIDGKTRWDLRDSGARNPKFSINQLNSSDNTAEVLQALGSEIGLESLGAQFQQLLSGRPLIFSEINQNNISHVRARILPSQTIKDQLCDVVEVVTRTKAVGVFAPATRFESTYFFARGDGSLHRVSDRFTSEDQPVEDSVLNIESQIMNPVLAPQTFQFIKPKNAVLDEEIEP